VLVISKVFGPVLGCFFGLDENIENTSKHFWAVRWAGFGLFRPDETCRNPSGWGGSKTRPPPPSRFCRAAGNERTTLATREEAY
jgi:hypothetical protein